jgi:hypothetical protein
VDAIGNHQPKQQEKSHQIDDEDETEEGTK